MLKEQGTLLFSGFVAVIIGLALISPIGNDVELAKVSSITITNESLSFSNEITTMLNETITLTNNNQSGRTAFDNLTELIALRNTTLSGNLMGFCNITLTTGILVCNTSQSNDSRIFADYRYTSKQTETLINDEILSLDAIRNSSSPSASMMGQCNITLYTGSLICNNTHTATGYVDYKYEPDTYVSDSSSRTMLTITILFFAVGILAIAIGFGWKSLKEGGIV